MSELVKLASDLKKANNISKSIARRLNFGTEECPTVEDALSQFHENRINGIKTVLDESVKVLEPSEGMKAGTNMPFLTIVNVIKKLSDNKDMQYDEVTLTRKQKQLLEDNFTKMRDKVIIYAGLTLTRLEELDMVHEVSPDILDFLTECKASYDAQVAESDFLEKLHDALPVELEDAVFSSKQQFISFMEDNGDKYPSLKRFLEDELPQVEVSISADPTQI